MRIIFLILLRVILLFNMVFLWIRFVLFVEDFWIILVLLLFSWGWNICWMFWRLIGWFDCRSWLGMMIFLLLVVCIRVFWIFWFCWIVLFCWFCRVGLLYSICVIFKFIIFGFCIIVFCVFIMFCFWSCNMVVWFCWFCNKVVWLLWFCSIVVWFWRIVVVFCWFCNIVDCLCFWR